MDVKKTPFLAKILMDGTTWCNDKGKGVTRNKRVTRPSRTSFFGSTPEQRKRAWKSSCKEVTNWSLLQKNTSVWHYHYTNPLLTQFLNTGQEK
jgi:hypothetical protein